MRSHHLPGRRRPSLLAVFALLAVPGALAHAQVSLSTVVDLAVKHSPRVKAAQADVEKARASLSEAKDVYIPTISVGAGLGQSYGYSTNPPTLFTLTSSSLVYNGSQRDIIRAARSSYESATLLLQDVEDTVAEDTALAYIALAHDQEREAVLRQETDIASRLVTIVQDRFDAGRDARIDLTSARLTAAQFRLSRLRAEDATADDREHLAGLLGLPAAGLRVETTLPPLPSPALLDSPGTPADSPAVAAAFAGARAKQSLAFGDARYLYRPQVSLFVLYNRYATFANSFAQLRTVYGSSIGANEEAFGVQITIPLFDKQHEARARESAAEASRSYQEAVNAQFLSRDGRSRLRHSIAELQARTEVAELERDYAQQQLEALQLQLKTPASTTTTPLTPKDEQNSRIAEREKYLLVLDTGYQLHEAQINLLRQTGQLQPWLRGVLQNTPNP